MQPSIQMAAKLHICAFSARQNRSPNADQKARPATGLCSITTRPIWIFIKLQRTIFGHSVAEKALEIFQLSVTFLFLIIGQRLIELIKMYHYTLLYYLFN